MLRPRTWTLAALWILHAVADAGIDNSWQQYIVGSQDKQVFPARIHSNSGNVTNAEGLLPNGNGSATLTRPTSADPTPEIVVDFGLNTVGFLAIDFAGASNNSPGIRLAFSETLQYLTNISDFTRSDNGDTITPGSDQIAVQAAAYNWTDTHGCQNGTRVCADGLHGFRYLRVYLDALGSDAPLTQSNGTVSISGMSLNYSGIVGTSDVYKGWFECSDVNLTQYWYAGAYTNEMITDIVRANDIDPRNASSPTLLGKLVLLDGAKRDRDPYSGDVAVSGLTDYYTYYIGEASANIIGDLANHQRSDGWIPPASILNYTLPLFDYPLWWAVTSWEYILYTGDTQYAQTHYPNMVKLLNEWCPLVTNTSSSLLSKGLDGTDSYGDYAFLARDAEVTYYNALYVLALQSGASMATLLNQTTDASTWTTRATTVSTAINSNLWDSSVGAYIDSNNGTVRHAQDGNSIAVLAGVANSTYATSALNYLETLALPYGNAFMDNDSLVPDGTDRVYAFLSYFEISARFIAGEVSSAFDELRRLYGWMYTHDPGVTFWEGISTNGTLYEGAYTSAAHGWSTGVVPILSQYVLGVKPTGVGYSTFSLKPYPGDITWAKGVVPVPAGGSIAVSWAVDSAGCSFAMNFTVPSGSKCDLAVPMASNTNGSLTLDGQKVWANSSDSGYAALAGVGPGSHVVRIC